MVDLSVIIVSYNTAELLRGCLRLVIDSLEYAPEAIADGYEIIVVDNASSDGSAAMVQAEFPQVQLIQNDANAGFAAANNQAIRQSSGRYLLLLNPDTVVFRDTIPKLMAFLDSHPEVGMVTGMLLNPDGSFQHGSFRFPNLWMSFFDFFPFNHRLIASRLNGRYPPSAYRSPFEIDHPLGACMMVRREVVEQVGPLSEEFFMYCEEIDWCLRIKKVGWLIYCQPEAKIVHFVAQSTRQFRDRMFVELHHSRFRLFKKHYSIFFQRAAKGIVALGIGREMLRAAHAYRQGKLSHSLFRARWQAYKEIFRIMRGNA